eukprot:CAMPEP_0113510258 /NCGR_PEP_ID=MMETSP0014_2-20120614/38033_1 /TAXON_ID=2857 /ORGANISM="Nitzschia sp." /LENGTH=813 /DNA_ID=CAMNT_0000406183 /DNA_START=427 /DNA_END=2869 /DNA_ORIENTATION=- /assembly_acc=CAM_ASM_000159
MAASTAPMSIQERIKAMNMVIADDVVVDDATKNGHWSSPSSSPSTPYKAAATVSSSSSSSNSSPDGFRATATGAASGGSAKRSSVIEIWKKREVSINKSLVTNKNNSMKTPPTPPPSQKLDFDEKFEEKKEEAAVANKGFAQTVTPERSNGPAPTPVPAPRRSNVRDSWKKKAVTLQQQSSIGPAGEQPAEERKYNTTTHKITPEKISNSPKGSGSKLSSSQKGTTSTGAVDELKSQWAKFGVQNLEVKEKNKDGQRMPTPHSPSAADTAVTPSLKETHSSSASQNSSDQETASPPASSTGRVRSTMVQQTPLAGGFLKRRTELPPQSDGSPAGFSPVILPSNKNNITKNQNHFVKLGQKHTSRTKNDEVEGPTKQQASVEGGNGGETSTTTPTSPRKNASSIVIGGATKKALMARRMRSKQRAAMDAAVNNKKTTDSPNASPTPTQENIVVSGSGPSSADPKQTISGGLKGDNSTRTYDRVEPPESPFSTAFERDFTLSISNSDSEDQPVPVAKSSTSEPEPCFDDWPGFPDDEGPSPIASKSSENSVQKSASTVSPEASSEKSVQPAPSALTSRASRRLHENRQNGIEVAQRERKGDDVAEPKSENSGQSKPVRDSEDIPARYLEMEQEPTEIQPPSPKPMYAPTQFDNTGHSDEVFSGGDNDENSTIASDAGSSVMQSTFASGMTSEATGFTEPKRKRRGRYSLVDVVSNPDHVVPDKFVAEKNASVASFAHAYEKISFSQLACDIGEEASSALDMEFWSKGMQSAGDTINKFVGNDLFPTTTKPKQPPLSTVNSGEEVAVEVEFIADSD